MPEYMVTSSFVLGFSRRENIKNLENSRNILIKFKVNNKDFTGMLTKDGGT
jgi:hypothetical protein